MSVNNRGKNAFRNIITGVVLKFFQIIGPFAIRTAMIYSIGVEYVGLNSLFTSVLQVLNLAELGVGSAMIYSMYEPVANDDKDELCKLLSLYKLYYRVIGGVIGILGIILVPFIPKLINGEVPNDMMYIYCICFICQSQSYRIGFLPIKVLCSGISKIRCY